MGRDGEETIEGLQNKVTGLVRELQAARSEISKLERQCEKVNIHLDSLRDDYENVCLELHNYRKAVREKVDVATQTG